METPVLNSFSHITPLKETLECNPHTDATETVGAIAAKDIRTAPIFAKYGIDFCCGGRKSLRQACEEKGISITEISEELDSLSGVAETNLDYAGWDVVFLSDFIYNQHHKFFYREDLAIKELMQKVVAHHAEAYPFLNELRRAYMLLSIDLHAHFKKEEQLVFPYIKTLEDVKLHKKTSLLATVAPLVGPLELMESDHEEAGEVLRTIRILTNVYAHPIDACGSFKLLYKKLEDLETDLHLHIHLENNILFPAALQLEREATNLV